VQCTIIAASTQLHVKYYDFGSIHLHVRLFITAASCSISSGQYRTLANAATADSKNDSLAAMSRQEGVLSNFLSMFLLTLTVATSFHIPQALVAGGSVASSKKTAINIARCTAH
jgi:hypothetical protein